MPTPELPFAHVLLPYDGSAPSVAALDLAIRVAKNGAALTIATIVDETPVLAESTPMAELDPTPLLEALDDEGKTLLAEAVARCRSAAIEPTVETVHETPVAGIVSLLDSGKYDLVVMGTHGRSGLAHMFLGSITEGVMRASSVPVLTVKVKPAS